MSNGDRHFPDYSELMRYEGKIVNLLNHNVHKYRYVGEKGKEYEVIQSVFNEINRLRQLTNKQIRWYAIIINLWMSFHRQRRTGNSKEGFLDISWSDTSTDFNFSRLDCKDASGPGIYTQLEKGKTLKLPVPSYIEPLELYVNEIARLGMLVGTKEKINLDYLYYKMERIASLLTGLLKDLDFQANEETWEEVYILTIKNASDNGLILEKPLHNNQESILTRTVNSVDFQHLILRRIQRIDQTKLTRYNNMDAFWNGFIP